MLISKKTVPFLLLFGVAVFVFVLFSDNHSETVISETAISETAISKQPTSSISVGEGSTPLLTASFYQQIVPSVPPSHVKETPFNKQQVASKLSPFKPVHSDSSVVIKTRKTPLDQLEVTKSPVEGGGTMIHLDDSYFVE